MPGMFKEQWGKVSKGEIRATSETNPKRLGVSDTQSTRQGINCSWGKITFLRLEKRKRAGTIVRRGRED